MRFSKMILVTAPLLMMTACTVGVEDPGSENVESAAQAIVVEPKSVESSVTQNGIHYIGIRAGFCHSDGVVVRDSQMIRLGVTSAYTDVTGITTFNDPARNAGERVCHNKAYWKKLGAYVCQANDQFVDPTNGASGTYTGDAVADWQIGPNGGVQTGQIPLTEYFDAPSNSPASSLAHPDKAVSSGLNFGYVLLNAEPCDTPSGNDYMLERVECCLSAPTPVVR
jgi:hypothetical protein